MIRFTEAAEGSLWSAGDVTSSTSNKDINVMLYPNLVDMRYKNEDVLMINSNYILLKTAVKEYLPPGHRKGAAYHSGKYYKILASTKDNSCEPFTAWVHEWFSRFLIPLLPEPEHDE